MSAGYSLKTRGSLLLLGFAVLPALLLFALLMHAYLDGARFRIENALDTVSQGLAAEARGALERQLGMLELGGRHPWNSLDPEASRQRLGLLASGNPELRSLAVIDAKGRLQALLRETVAPEVLQGRVGRSVADRDYFRIAFDERRAYLGNVLVGRLPGNEPIVALSTPILGPGGDVMGVLQATLELERLDRRLESSLRRFPHALLLDRQGQVVFASSAMEFARGERVAGLEPARFEQATPDTNDMLRLELSGADYFAMAEPVLQGWVAVALLPRRALGAVLLEASKVAAGVLLATLIAAWFAARWGSVWITQPVQALSTAIRGLQPGGNRGPGLGALPLPRELRPIADEVESLARREREAFLELDAALREREHEIERRTASLRRAVDALRDESLTDSLTGVGNYRAYRQWLEEDWRAIAASGAWLGVLQVDIDHFKRYNDRYGHPQGDVCLRRIAELLKAEGALHGVRLARTGGEEFTLLGVCSGPAPLQTLALHLVEAVAALELPHEDSPLQRVTLSVGAACARWRAGVGPEEIIAAADAALYAAKRGGRNRMQVAP